MRSARVQLTRTHRHDGAVLMADSRSAAGPGECPPRAAHWACADHYPGPAGLGAPCGRWRACRCAGRPGQCAGRGWQGHRGGAGRGRRRIRRPPRRRQPGSRGISPHQGSRGRRRRSARPGRPASSQLSGGWQILLRPWPRRTGTSCPRAESHPDRPGHGCRHSSPACPAAGPAAVITHAGSPPACCATSPGEGHLPPSPLAAASRHAASPRSTT
jgi:hypothetical protein